MFKKKKVVVCNKALFKKEKKERKRELKGRKGRILRNLKRLERLFLKIKKDLEHEKNYTYRSSHFLVGRFNEVLISVKEVEEIIYHTNKVNWPDLSREEFFNLIREKKLVKADFEGEGTGEQIILHTGIPDDCDIHLEVDFKHAYMFWPGG